MAHVLVVDDDASVRITVQQVLKFGKHDITLAEDVARAEAALSEHRFDVVLSDINMPGRSGLELLKTIHDADPDTSVVMVTGEPSPENAREAVRQGAFDFLPKPVEAMDLLDVVGAACRQTVLRRENRRLDKENEEYRLHLEQKVNDQVSVISEKERLLQEAQKLNAIGLLAAGVAHEINTPVQFIGDVTMFLCDAMGKVMELLRLYRQLMADCGAGEKLEQAMAKAKQAEDAAALPFIESELQNALTITQDGIGQIREILGAMKDFSHIDRSRMKSADLNRTVQGAVTISRNAWKYVAEVKTDLDPKLPPVECFPGDINQAVLNLMVNAAHAIEDAAGPGKSRGLITVSTRAQDDHVEIRVTDTGTGIPKDIQSRMFEPFFTTKAVGRGTGQGLAMVRSAVVDRHKGTVTFETEEGKGTTFFIRLPIKGAASPAQTAER